MFEDVLASRGVRRATFKDRFFLQAEDGIRDLTVTGVQTCALPICEGDPVASDGPVSVSGDGDYETPAGAAPAAAGTYYWVASYGGDANNEGVSSGCADEPVVVGPARARTPPNPRPSSGADGAIFLEKESLAGAVWGATWGVGERERV